MFDFFKVIIEETLVDQRLELPPMLVRKYKRKLPDFLFLEVEDGKTWKIKVNQGRKGFWASRGWPEFAHYYSIKRGYFIIFENEKGKPNYFHVDILDYKTGVQINYPSNISESRTEIEEATESLGLQSVKRNRAKTQSRKTKPSVPETNEGGKRRGKEVCGTVEGDSEASQSEFHFFKVSMRPSLVNGLYMNIPTRFAKKHLGNEAKMVNLVDPKRQKQWRVRYIPSKCEEANPRLSAGWMKFIREFGAQVGDVLAFELIKVNEIDSFQVKIL